MYISPARLRQLVLEAQASGRLSEELCGILSQIMRGYCQRHFRNGVPGYSVDDLEQEFLLRMMLRLNRADLSRNLFSWLTACAANLVRERYRCRWKYDSLDQLQELGVEF